MMNWKWICENDSELKVNSRNRKWIRSRFAKKIVNLKLIHEGDSELKDNCEIDNEFEVDSRKR